MRDDLQRSVGGFSAPKTLCHYGALYKIERYLGACQPLLHLAALVMYSPDAVHEHSARHVLRAAVLDILFARCTHHDLT